MASPDLSVVVPTYQERSGIVATLRALHEALDELGVTHEILVVDNASPDGTANAVEQLGDPRVRVLLNEDNLGKGASVRRGMLDATGALRLHCDADCASSLEALPRMFDLARQYDVVVGSRLAAGADVRRRQPVRRRIFGRGFGILCRLVLRERTRDLFCGFKLWRANAAEAAFGSTGLSGWTFDAETLAMARALGFTIAETGITWTDRPGSRLSMPRIVVPVSRELFQARRRVAAARRTAVRAAALVEAAERQA